MPQTASHASSSSSSSSTTAPSNVSLKVEPSSRTATGSASASNKPLAMAPYIPPASFMSDFNLPFSGDGTDPFWELESGDAGGVNFVTGAQLEKPSIAQPSGSANGNQAAQIPSHVAKNNPFLNKLRSMVDDPATNDLICWSADGETFLVPNHVRFGDEVLPRFFKHNRFSSFVRQLNMYGFHKVPHLQQGALKSDVGQESELWEFRNDNFQRDRPDLLLHMQRKKGVRNEDEAVKGRGREIEHGEGSVAPLDDINGALMKTGKIDAEKGAMQLASVWSAIQAIQSAQQGINDNLRHLHNSNSELFREAAEQRSRTQKQEETINKMLRFLAGVFGAQDVGGLKGSDKRGGQNGTQDDDRGRRRVVVVRPSYEKGNTSRLMIKNADGEGDQIEELEVPMYDDESIANIQELSPNTRSNTNSPPDSSPRLKPVDSPDNKTKELPSISSEVTSTPGGGRRISQQAGSQILNALASGDGSAWLANLFGQQQNGNGQQATTSRNGSDTNAATPNGSGFKLDAQTLATLQSVLGNMAGNESGPGSSNSYFGGASAKGGSSTVSNGKAASSWGSAQQPSVPVNAQARTPAAASKATKAGQTNGNDNTSVLTPFLDSNQASKLTRNHQDLQGTGQDAAMVQNAFSALLEGLKGEAKSAPTANGGYEATNNGSAENDPTNVTSLPEAKTFNDAPSNEVDMDMLLKEFLESNASGSGVSTLTPNGMDGSGYGAFEAEDGATPEFAFSPHVNGDGAYTTAKIEEQAEGGGPHTNGVDNTTSHPPTTPSSSLSKKRKTAAFEGALGADIERANAQAIKHAKIE